MKCYLLINFCQFQKKDIFVFCSIDGKSFLCRLIEKNDIELWKSQKIQW